MAIPVGFLVHLNGLADIQATTAGRIPYNTILIPRNKCVNTRLSIVIGLLFRTCIARQPISHTRFGVINLRTNTTDDIVVHVLSYVVHLGEHPCVGFLRQLVAIKQAAAIAQPLGITNTTMIAIKRICGAQLVLEAIGAHRKRKLYALATFTNLSDVPVLEYSVSPTAIGRLKPKRLRALHRQVEVILGRNKLMTTDEEHPTHIGEIDKWVLRVIIRHKSSSLISTCDE